MVLCSNYVVHLTDVLGDLEYILLTQIMVVRNHGDLLGSASISFDENSLKQRVPPVPLKGLLPPDSHRYCVVIHIRIDSCAIGSSRCNEDMIDNSSSKNNE